MTEYASRDDIRMVTRRLDTIDATGTRGVAVLAVQVQELAKDWARHEQAHETERRERAAGRRWLFMAAVALVAAVDGPIVTVLLALHH